MKVKVEGLEELVKALKELPIEIQKRPLRSAVSAASKLIADSAISKVPVDTGNLRKAIYRYRSRSESGNGRETFFVGVRKGKKKVNGRTVTTQGEAWYWRFVEFGTKNQRAQPFLRPAFESNKSEAIEKMKMQLKKAIDNQVRKLSRK